MEKKEPVKMEKQGPLWKDNRKRILILLLGIAPLLMGALCCQSGSAGNYLSTSNGLGGSRAFSDGAFAQLQMMTSTVGWAITSNAVVKTVDAGKTWTDVTPTDWEPLKNNNSQGTASTSTIDGIISGAFFDPDTAWIVASTKITQDDINAAQTGIAAGTSQKDGTATVDRSKVPPVGTAVYVRGTHDGGQTWITSNPISVKNLASVSPPNFINIHEGWLEVMTSPSDGGMVGLVLHTVDGGISWYQTSWSPFVIQGPVGQIDCPSVCIAPPIRWGDIGGGAVTSRPVIKSDYLLSGLTVTPNCVEPGQNVILATGDQLPTCPAFVNTSTNGCIAPGTKVLTGWGTGGEKKKSVYLERAVRNNSGWDPIWKLLAPLGAPKQDQESVIISNPPVVFPDRDGILPVQMQSDPSGNDPTHFFLHLFRLRLKALDGSYNLTDYSPTTPFAVPLVWGHHTLSALDSGRVFVMGQDYNNGTYGDWNLHEFNGRSWITLTNKIDKTIPDLQGVLNGGMANVDFISDTEGWATDGAVLYHIMIANGAANWSQSYPDPTVKPNDPNSTNPTNVVNFTRNPGKVVDAPQNLVACNTVNPDPNGGGSGKSDAKSHTIKFVNKTGQDIWVGASGDTRPEPGNWDGELTPGSSNSLTIKTPSANLSSVRFWGRTGCVNGKCETGDCGPAVLCGGAGGIPPASLAEFAFNAYGGQVYYDVSLVDGYNLPMLISSSNGTGPDNCGAKACVDLNTTCPAPLKVSNASGQVIACNSACNAFHTDQYCCLGQYGPGVCNPDTWPSDVDSAKFFKDAYPHAYSFAFNDSTSTYTCDETCDITVTFGLTT